MPDLTSAQSQPVEEIPDVADKDLLKRYRQRVESTQEWRKNQGYDDTWKRLRDLYRLKHFETTSSRDRIAVAISFATVNVILPSIAISHPKFVVWAASEDPDMQAKAAITEGVANYWWRHYNFNGPWERVVKDFLIYGIGWGKTTWRYEEAEEPVPQEEIEAEHAALVEQADAAAQEAPEMAAEMPTDAEILASIPTTRRVVVEDCPALERISPFDILVDTEATSPDDLRWIAQRVVRPVDEVRADKRYAAKARKALKADGSTQWFQKDTTLPDLDKSETGRITLWEFYDLVRETVCVFANDNDSFLVPPTKIPYSFGHPFVQLRNYEVPDQFYPIGELEAIEPLQRELNATRSAMVEARQLDIPKYLYRRGSIGRDALSALKSTVPYTGVPVDTDDPFTEILTPVPRNDASPQMYQHSDVIEKDIDVVSGVSEYARGVAPEVRRTATEAAMIQDNANARASEKLATLETALADVGRRIIALGKAYLTGEAAARIVNDAGAAIYWTFTAEDIEGEFDFEIEAGSTQPRNETFRRQQAAQLLQTLSPFLGTGQINDPVLISHVLREGFGIKNPERFLGPLALQMMQAGGMLPPAGATEPGQPEEGPQDQPLAPGVDPSIGGGALGPGAA